MAEAAGIALGDTLVSLDGWPLRSPAELRVALRAAGGSPVVSMRFERAGEMVETSVPAQHAATEKGVLYDAIERPGARLRTMLSCPLGPGPRPAVLFVQGLSVATMDGVFPDLFRGLRDEGFVTMRLEKRGVGDSEGEAPEEGDFASEVEDVRAALDALARHDQVDPEAVFLFGHSVGGMIAPLVADRARGVIVYGSSARPWLECLEASTRRQWTLRGASDVEERVLRSREEMRTEPVIDGRSAAYHRQLHDADIAGAWSRVGKPLLVLHGEYDWVVGEDEAEHVAQLASGAFRSVPRVDHLFSAHDSLEASLRSYGKGLFDMAIVREASAWMRSKSRVASR
jgi:pimeloyl-ACP methyl ester carboxylesterase